MSKQRVAIAGAGNLGVPLIKALLNGGFRVTVLTRSSPSETAARIAKLGVPNAENNPDLDYAVVDYESVPSLTSAMKDHFAAISTITSAKTGDQQPIIDAAVAAGVTRFLPGEFGSNTLDANAVELASFKGKAAAQQYLADKSAQNPSFSYTLLINGPFFDWGMMVGFLTDFKNRKTTLYDGGNVPFSTTTLDTVGRAVVAILSPQHLEQTKNRAVYIHDTVITQNQLIETAKKYGLTDWTTTDSTVEEMKNSANEALAKGDFSVIINLVKVGIFGGEKYGADFSKFGTDNELLGLPIMNDKQVEEVIVNQLPK